MLGAPLRIALGPSLLLVALLRENANRDGLALLNSIATVAARVKWALPLLTLLILWLPGSERRAPALSRGLERYDDFVAELELRDVLTLALLFSLLLLLLRLSILPRFADLSLRRAADHIDVLPLPAGRGLATFTFALLSGLLLLLPLPLLIPQSLSALSALTFADRPPDYQEVIGLCDDCLPGGRVNAGFADSRYAGERSADPLLLLLLLILLLLSAGLISLLSGAVLFLGGNARHEQQCHEQSG